MEALEAMGTHATYTKLCCQGPTNVTVHNYLAGKLYEEPGRVVMVLTTILDDERFPCPPDGYVSRETTWHVVSLVDDHRCCIKYCTVGEMPRKSKREELSMDVDDEIPALPRVSFAAFADFIMSSYERNADKIKAHMDLMLGYFSRSANQGRYSSKSASDHSSLLPKYFNWRSAIGISLAEITERIRES
ncbi:Aste57867_13174 [Aphanomyces stellatus]|uniref:Aste57867_13174 protein n=1 Tax=Aphanomyces stellatus TaxID=120398 RepID=A0A485KXX0_9STRA|nr:hypothetical protein As57867_013125 [Aphanomyces stellatus]VFT90015.1 Aste57867_13174 [Aphanomyces stellatus]